MPGDMLQAAEIIFRERNAISGSIKGIRRLLKHGRQKILISGAGGTGKTTLCAMLGSQSWRHRQKIPGKYISSIGAEFGKIRGLVFSETTVLPGNLFYRNTGVWDNYLKQVADDNYNGVIHVVSGGFHAFSGSSYQRLYGSKYSTAAKFLVHHREKCYTLECETLQSLAESIRKRKKPFWILTLVTKEDLWAPHEQAIKKLYKSDRYAEILRKLRTRCSVQITHEIVPVSLEQVNMRDGANEEIEGAKVVAGFDRVKSLASIKRFFETFEQLVGIRDRAYEEQGADE